MAYREKIAWLSLIAMVVAYGPYFAAISFHLIPAEPLPGFRQLSLLGGVSVLRVIILGTGYLLLRLKSPLEARMAPDERDSAITRRSVSFAYYTLVVGMIFVGCFMPFNSGGWAIVNPAIMTIVLAELVHYGFVVEGYRKLA